VAQAEKKDQRSPQEFIGVKIPLQVETNPRQKLADASRVQLRVRVTDPAWDERPKESSLEFIIFKVLWGVDTSSSQKLEDAARDQLNPWESIGVRVGERVTDPAWDKRPMEFIGVHWRHQVLRRVSTSSSQKLQDVARVQLSPY
jgi:hypothetical protein